MTVAEHLAAAREAHAQYRAAAGHVLPSGDVQAHPNRSAKYAALKQAFVHRAAAHTLDPKRTDPAWDDDEAQMGVPSGELLAFYRSVKANG